MRMRAVFFGFWLAAGVLEAGDVILGIDGQPFTEGARVENRAAWVACPAFGLWCGIVCHTLSRRGEFF